MSIPDYPESAIGAGTTSDNKLEFDDQNLNEDTNQPEMADEASDPTESNHKQTKNEKKARKLLLKLGLKPLPGIAKIILKRSKNNSFAINKPDVFIVPGTDSYIIFGVAATESHTPQTEAAKKFINSSLPNVSEPQPKEKEETIVDIEEFDSSGLSEIDISTVMSQGKCSRDEAIKALKKTDDVVDAILYVS